ncbi:hypothetical protein LR68_00698 [Anoxybacillus sp. BCO1]|nr:hypothetical protein LR68_00698 [Anoxybacillus sp. BCO1]
MDSECVWQRRKGSWRMEHIQMQLQQLFEEIEQLEKN